MSGFETEAQQAIYTALSGSLTLDGLLARDFRFPSLPGIYDYMPQPDDAGNATLFPFITIGEDQVADWSTDTASGVEDTAMVHIWSRQPSWQQAKAIAAEVKAALHRQELSTTGVEFIACEYQATNAIRDPDGQTLQLAMEFLMTLDEAGYGG